MIAIIDTGGANLASVIYALERLGQKSILTTDSAQIEDASHVILPGVGAAADSMVRLQRSGLIPLIKSLSKPVLGICLGMQLLFDHSEEWETPCLGVLTGTVQRLHEAPGITVPHMGWNRLERIDPSTPLLQGLSEGSYFYFVHSYFVGLSEMTRAMVNHGGCFSAVVQKDHFFGVQFHPEKSGVAGARLLRNFITL